ncbi:ATP-grasp domain-containing protein [Sphaerisporangium aureirubrum]|uniref:Acetyl-CoA carboxylase biotin carboxylase subunit family protein n=1 Tax=Sphaerisporangium aureirubrum TaxID=1544736 RepID=A0ABW1NU97_9ACTN
MISGRTARAHVVVLHRWRDRYADYARYLDHDAFVVTYVTTELGRRSVPGRAAGVARVAATDDFTEVRAAVAGLAARFGPPRHVVALNEGDLDTAAALRGELGCGGQDSAALARFRDKLTMVAAVAAAGLPVPATADAPDAAAVAAFAARHGWPLVVKPRRGTASRDVLVMRSPADLSRLDGRPPEPRLVQTYVADPILHVDGVWTGDALGPWRASRYVNTCLDFAEGVPLGSVEVDDPGLLGPLEGFTAAVGAALGPAPWVFHLEVFAGTGPSGAPAFVFLEAGARVGGAEIPFVWREVHGFDLMAAAVDIQLGRPPAAGSLPYGETAGWLLLPVPVAPPCRVVGCDGPAPAGDGPYAQVVPRVGTVIPRAGGYEHVGARFRFRGPSSREVEAALARTAAWAGLRCEPVPG